MLTEFGKPETVMVFGLNVDLHPQSLHLLEVTGLRARGTAVLYADGRDAAQQVPESNCNDAAHPAAVEACDADFLALLVEAPLHQFFSGEAENALDVELAKVLGIETQQDLMPILEMEESLLQADDHETAEAANNANAPTGALEPVDNGADDVDDDVPIDVSHIVDFDTRCSSVGLESRGNLQIFHTASGRQLGRLYLMWDAKHVQGVCKNVGHVQCKTIVSPAGQLLKCQRDVAEWLLQGMSCSQVEHQKAAYDLKVKYGMKPRARRT